MIDSCSVYDYVRALEVSCCPLFRRARGGLARRPSGKGSGGGEEVKLSERGSDVHRDGGEESDCETGSETGSGAVEW